MTLSIKDSTVAEAFVSAAWLTDVGRVRTKNEDALVVADLTEAEAVATPEGESERRVGSHGLLLAVADGVGGARAGEVASCIAVEHLAQTMIATVGRRPVSEWLREGLRSANREIRRVGRETPERRGMAATITAAVVHEGRALIGQVGDSRCYLIRDGQAQQVTKDQSMVQALVDAGVFSPEDAAASPHRNIILKALGAEDEVEPDVSLVDLASGDCLLLCSDGLSNPFR